MTEGVCIEPAWPEDAEAIAAIYAHHVLYGTATFEIVPPAAEEIAARMAKVGEAGLPWLAARGVDGALMGYASATPFHPRAAYRHTCENSIYLRDDMRGRGIGKELLAALIDGCTAAGMRQMIALIAASEPASLALHQRAGFVRCGQLASVGRKHGRWLDVIYMQRALGPGDGKPPELEPR